MNWYEEGKLSKEDLDRHFEQIKRENLLRKQEHPGWPTQKVLLYTPGGERKVVEENVPIGHWQKEGYCKYCYEKHSDWWEMDPKNFTNPENSPAVLCGHCEHVSLWIYC